MLPLWLYSLLHSLLSIVLLKELVRWCWCVGALLSCEQRLRYVFYPVKLENETDIFIRKCRLTVLIGKKNSLEFTGRFSAIILTFGDLICNNTFSLFSNGEELEHCQIKL